MTSRLTISIDAMGGDNAPGIVIAGADLFLQHYPEMHLLLFGDKDQLQPLLATYPRVAAVSEVCHTSEMVSMEDKPGQVLRKGRQTSMWLAIDAVKQGRAQAVVSAGNTGALMALAKFQLRTLEGIDRPAIGTVWPKKQGQCVVLDVGANVEASAKQLADFAILGWAFAGAVLNKSDPSVALLNIGSEELKGPDTLREAAEILRDDRLGLNFIGFVEGDDLTTGSADVVVTDGFTGNIALKTAEGTARLLAHYMRDAFTGSVISRLGAWLATAAFNKLKVIMDPSRVNGGVFLGLNGIVVKSHGGADNTGFASALDLAADLAGSEFSSKISGSLVHLNAKLNQDQSADQVQTSDDGENINTGMTAQRI